jgi:PilX N-terminal
MSPCKNLWTLHKVATLSTLLVRAISIPRKLCHHPLHNQKGAVLVIALMLLAVLTILGVAALNTTTTEIRISGNEKVYKEAFYRAEAGVAYSVQSGVALFPSAAIDVTNPIATPADLAAAAPGTTLQYIDKGGSPRRVQVISTGTVPGGGTSVIIAGIVGIISGYQKGTGIGEEEQYAH